MTVRLVEVRIEWLCRCDLAIRLTRRGPRRPRRAAACAACYGLRLACGPAFRLTPARARGVLAWRRRSV